MTADLFQNIAIGLDAALTPANLFYCFIGVLLGTIFGVIPGVGVLVALSLLFPFTFHLDVGASLVMLAGLYYGTTYGGSTAAILLNVPGTPSAAVTTLDGHPMAQKGRAGVALLMTTIASFIGGSVGIIAMMLFSPIIAENALRFGSSEYFALMALGLVAASTMSAGSPLKGIAMVFLGLMFGVVGTDITSGVQRFTFGHYQLMEGISLVAIAMGIFGVSEIISSVRSAKTGNLDPKTITFKSMIPSREEVRRSWGAVGRGSGVGTFFGTLPGTGGMIAAFMAYALEKKISRNPEEFGKGAIEGLMAPESANNAADQSAFIPTMTLGIPGSATMAIILGVLIINGLTPGPALVIDQPEVFWGLVMSFWIGNLMLLVLNIPLIGLWVRLLAVPYHLLFPAILMFLCIGVYSVGNSIFDVYLVLFFGAVGYLMRILDFPPAPLILGFVLGPLMEEHFQRALLISRGDFATFVGSPISASTIGLTAILLLWMLWASLRPKRSPSSASGKKTEAADHQ